jgi:hypothetical protein
MHNINHLAPDERVHFILCDCGNYVDMRNLEQVFLHQHDMDLPAINWQFAVKVGDPQMHCKNQTKKYLN